MALPKKEKKNCFGNCGNPIAENVKKKYIYIYIYIGNCGNPIAEIANIYIYIYTFSFSAMGLPDRKSVV